MKTAIFNLTEVGKKVAFVKGNRNVDKKNLKQKKTSIVECGQLVPVIIIEGEVAVENGLVIIDCKSGIVVPNEDAHNYIVVIEGQHRYTAIIELQEDDKKNNTSDAPADVMAIYALNYKDKSVKKLISELNRTSVIWDGKDYSTGAALCNPTNDLLKFAKELANLKSIERGDNLPTNGYPIATISKLATFGSQLTTKVLAASMEKGVAVLPSSNLERAELVLETALRVGFTHKYLSHKYFIDWFIDEWHLVGNSVEAVCTKVLQLKKPQVEEITKINCENYIQEIRKVINAEVQEALPELKSA